MSRDVCRGDRNALAIGAAFTYARRLPARDFPTPRSSAQHPRTCGPGPRRCPRNSGSVQPASSRASASRPRLPGRTYPRGVVDRHSLPGRASTGYRHSKSANSGRLRSHGTARRPAGLEEWPVGESFSDRDRLSRTLILQKVPDIPTTCYREQPQLSLARLAAKERQHRPRISRGQPLRLGHGQSSGSFPCSVIHTSRAVHRRFA